jgi:hypothetical protein
MMLMGVSHDERDFSCPPVIEQVVTPNRNQLPDALDHQCHSGDTIDLGEVRDLVRPQVHMRIEIPALNGLHGKVTMESH